MTKSEMLYSDWGLLGPIILFLNQYFNNFLPEYLVLWLAMLWCTIDMLRYCTQVSYRHILDNARRAIPTLLLMLPFVLQVCLEICDHLHIELFRIPYPPPKQLPVAGSSSTSMQGGPNAAPSLSQLVQDRNGLNATGGIANKRQTRSTKKNVH